MTSSPNMPPAAKIQTMHTTPTSPSQPSTSSTDFTKSSTPCATTFPTAEADCERMTNASRACVPGSKERTKRDLSLCPSLFPTNLNSMLHPQKAHRTTPLLPLPALPAVHQNLSKCKEIQAVSLTLCLPEHCSPKWCDAARSSSADLSDSEIPVKRKKFVHGCIHP